MGWPHLVTEYGAVAQKLLPKHPDEPCFEFDAIVVGSGMGGSVIAASLADEKKKVLVLEAGSLLFETHVANIPRKTKIGKFDKHIWSTYEDWSVKNYENVNGSEYDGAQAYNLGGRSMFWGSTIPELAQWELDAWPKSIQQYLTKGDGYPKARQTFNADIPEPLGEFHQVTTNTISETLGKDWEVKPAPAAVEYVGATEWSIPAGLFSGADLLLENAMTNTQDIKDANPGICVNLNHLVLDVIFQDNKAVGVNAIDMCKGKLVSYFSKTVILAAGTLESAKIALQSKINNPLIGVGITDHPIKYRHFSVEAEKIKGLTVPCKNKPQSTKLLIRHEGATIDHYAFDIVVELGAQFNQGRYVDHDHIDDEMRERGGWIPCEIVVQFYSDLDDNNTVTLGGWNKKVNVCMKSCKVPEQLVHEAHEIAGKILRSLDAQPILNERPLFDGDKVSFDHAKLGRVAHEVGTLRMPVNGKKGVVDENLKFEGYDNLYACDNSVFPCSPAGNPSLTLVALARRCAKEVAQVIRYIDHPEEKVIKPVEQPACDPEEPVKGSVVVPVTEVVEVDEGTQTETAVEEQPEVITRDSKTASATVTSLAAETA